MIVLYFPMSALHRFTFAACEGPDEIYMGETLRSARLWLAEMAAYVQLYESIAVPCSLRHLDS